MYAGRMLGQDKDVYDICIIGGGINGTGIARDAAGRGLKTVLIEQNDLASATSSKSTKLIHGGLRYLEYFDFRLVHEALRERDVLLRLAPHIIWPLTFVLPDAANIRPFWMIRLGLYLYDLLSISRLSRKFPFSKTVDQAHAPYAGILRDCGRGVRYSDGWVQDTRLTVLNAVDAKERGATILTRVKCLSFSKDNGIWSVRVRHAIDGRENTLRARMIVNAAGPWVHDLLMQNGYAGPGTPDIRLVQGSHIIVRKLHDGDHAYMFQQPDKRIIFAIPYEVGYTLIGTTDRDYDGDPTQVEISEEETAYLIDAANLYFKKQISHADIVSTYSGVRPLLRDDSASARETTRDYKIHVVRADDGAALVSVFGGKITTYRKLAEAVMVEITRAFSMPDRHWTARLSLPGGDIPSADYEIFVKAQIARWPERDAGMLSRYARQYGTRMNAILAREEGAHFGENIFEAELRYLIETEFTITADDVLWRRSKLGLHLSQDTVANIKSALPALVKEITGHDIRNLAGA